VGIDEDDAVALFLQRLHRLSAGIVEFAGLADHDGTGADDQDGGDICSFGHQLSDWKLGTKKGRACCASPKPRARVTLARGWSLDQIPHPRNPQKRAINGDFRGFGASVRLRSASYGRTAFAARWLAQPKLAEPAKAGGPAWI